MVIVVKAGAFRDKTLPLFDCSDEARDALGPAGRLPYYIKDHRVRLRLRFMEGGAAAMPDYELLELILFRSIPRQDVKPLARRLMEHSANEELARRSFPVVPLSE